MALESLPKIAPALFSAEQDLIQIYNKKSDTVGTINASYIGGSTPPSGVSGAIQFSNGSAFASDASNLFWDDANNRLGVGTNNPYAATFQVKGGGADITTNAVFVENSAGLPALIIRNNGTVNLPGNLFAEANISVGSSSSLGARLGIIGSGSTNATTSLLVQNSSGTQLLRLTDDGRLTIGVNATYFGDSGNYISNYAGGVSALIVQGQGSSSKTLQLRGGAGTADIQTWETTNGASTLGVFTYDGKLGIGTNAPSATMEILGIGSSGATNSLRVLNSVGGEILVARNDRTLQAPLNLYFGNILFGPNFWVQSDGSVNIGTASTPSAKLQVKGSGTTSGTTSLLVQNSTAVESMSFTDDGVLTVAQASNTGSPKIRVGTSGFNNDFNQLRLYSAGSMAMAIQSTSIAFNGGGSYSVMGWLVNTHLSLSTNDSQVFMNAQGTSFGKGSGAATSSIVEITSTTKGFLPPRMTDAQVRAIATPAVGLMAYNTDLDCPVFYSAAGWRKVSHSVM